MTVSDPLSSRLVKIYKTRRKPDMYLYVDFEEDLGRVPEELLSRFGVPELALSLELTPDRRLARAEAGHVLAAIGEQGFYLQMPPEDGGTEAELLRSARAQQGERSEN